MGEYTYCTWYKKRFTVGFVVTNSRFYKREMPTKTRKNDCTTFVITYVRICSLTVIVRMYVRMVLHIM